MRRFTMTTRSMALLLACAAATVWTLTAMAQQGAPAPQAERPATDGSASGAAPAEQPQRPFGERRFRDFRGPRERDGGRDPAASGGPPVDDAAAAADPSTAGGEDRPVSIEQTEEWRKAMEFMKEQSPKRFEMINDFAYSPDRQQAMREMFFSRYRWLERLKNTDRDMYEIQLRQIGIEDELWAFRTAVRWRQHVLTPEEVSRVREKVIALIDARFEERELRVQRLRDILKREEEILAGERARRDMAVVEGTASIERGERGGILSGGSGPGGPGPGGGPGRGGGPPPSERRPPAP